MSGLYGRHARELEQALREPLDVQFDPTQATRELRRRRCRARRRAQAGHQLGRSLKRALSSASSAARAKVGASGIDFAALLETLGIRLKRRVVVEKGPVGLGVQQLCELAPVAGIETVGPLPIRFRK